MTLSAIFVTCILIAGGKVFNTNRLFGMGEVCKGQVADSSSSAFSPAGFWKVSFLTHGAQFPFDLPLC